MARLPLQQCRIKRQIVRAVLRPCCRSLQGFDCTAGITAVKLQPRQRHREACLIGIQFQPVTQQLFSLGNAFGIDQ